MSIYNRYKFVKKIYPDYLILILNNKKELETFDCDLKIVKMIGINEFFDRKINYIIVNNLDIIKIRKCLSNNYFYYFKIELVLDIIDNIKKEIGDI